MADPAVECALRVRASTGESPFWSAREAALYWIDIQGPALHRFDPETGQDRAWAMPAHIGCYALAQDGHTAVVALRTGLHELDLASGALHLLAAPPFDPALFRFNEGACDARGRFWLGVMFDPLDPACLEAPSKGHLHSFTRAGGLMQHDDLAEIHNGMAWDAGDTTMFLSHTEEHTIFAHSFDAEAGRLSGRRMFATVGNGTGEPDGGAVDEEGCYWSALHSGGRLRRFRPDGRVDRDLPMPVSNPTMCAFGGPDLDVLYVTTASKGVPADQRCELDGALFRCAPGVRGLRSTERRFSA